MECCAPTAKGLPQALASGSRTLPPATGSITSQAGEEKLVYSPAPTFSKVEPKAQSKVSVVRLLLQLDDESLREVFEDVLRQRPDLSSACYGSGAQEVASSDKKEVQHIDQSTQVPDGGSDGSAHYLDGAHDPVQHDDCVISLETPPLEAWKKPSLPTVQFSAETYYANEEKKSCAISVIRVGDPSLIAGLTGKSVVHWKTEDGSAKAGVTYVAASGKVEFGPATAFQEIKVEMIDNEDWNPTLDFFVVFQEEGIQNAELHRYHNRCRVKVIDDDSFPSNRYKQHLRNDEVDRIPVMQLVLEYVKIHLKHKSMRAGIKKAVATDLCENINFILFLVLKVWMINHILMPGLEKTAAESDDERTVLLTMFAGFFSVPHFFFHILAYRRTHWRLDGAPRKLLQVSLVRKFMSYSGAIRKKVDHGEFLLVLFREIPDVVEFVYRGCFPIVKHCALLIMLLLYQTVGTRALGLTIGEIVPVSMNCGIVLTFPIVAAIVMKVRYAAMDRSMTNSKIAELSCSEHTIDMLNNYNLLADYHRRGTAAYEFEGRIDNFNNFYRDHNAREVNNLFIFRSLTIVFCSGWIFFGGLLLSSGHISMGTYLAEWDIIDKIGSCWQQIYQHMLKMQSFATELKHIVRLMNYEVEDPAEEAYMSLCAEKGQALEEGIAKDHPDCVLVDELPIRMVGFSYSYDAWAGFKNISVDLHQGLLHLIAGRRDTGKTTLLKLLGGRILPLRDKGSGSGYIYTPQHLHILHISMHPHFFEGTLYDNLTYGVRKGDKDANLERVLNICKTLNIMPQTLCHLTTDANARIAHWNEELSRSDRQILNMVRGLVANPELLCIHKPTLGLGPNTVPIVLKALQKFVKFRGVEQDPERILFRRPRTCVFTSSCQQDLEYADAIHHPFRCFEDP